MRPRSSKRDLCLLLGLALFGLATVAGAVWITRASTLNTLRTDARTLAVHWAYHISGEIRGTSRTAATPPSSSHIGPDATRFQTGQYAGFVRRYIVFDAAGAVLARDQHFTMAQIAALRDTPAFKQDRERALASAGPVLRYAEAITPHSTNNVATVLVPVPGDESGSRLVLVEADQSAAFAIIRRAVRAVIILVVTLMAIGIGIPLLFVWRRIGDHWRLQEHVQFLASNDSLTGLPNRSLFVRTVGDALARARATGTKAAILSLDIDRFRQTNDALGHPAGDQILKHVATTIRDTISQFDADAARLGGDEFAILVRGDAAHERALHLARSLRDRLESPHIAGPHELVASVSIGMAVGPCDGKDALTLIKHADIALNHARAAGPNASRFYTPSMERDVQRRDTLDRTLRRALEQDELFLLYQPQFDLFTGRVTGYEALLRWNHPEEGVVSPADFIASAEETGLILEMGAWALRTGCRYAASWPEPMKIAINLSAMQVHHGDIHQTVADILQETGLPPERLELEITESLLLQNVEQVQAVLQKFADLGVSLAIDDFGTGYSSLSYLASFRFTKIKIDRCFVAGIESGEESPAVIRAVVGLGKALGVDVTAEGVEKPEQVAFLRASGCRNVQGFLCGRPEPEILTGWDATVVSARIARPERAAGLEQAVAAEPLPVTQITA